jgi:hypothetical protein
MNSTKKRLSLEKAFFSWCHLQTFGLTLDLHLSRKEESDLKIQELLG